MNNDRLSSLALMHIHRDFSVDLDKVLEKFVSAKTRRTDFGQFKINSVLQNHEINVLLMYSIYPWKHLRTHHFASSQKIILGLVACTAKKVSYALDIMLHCLSFVLRIVITPLVSSTTSVSKGWLQRTIKNTWFSRFPVSNNFLSRKSWQNLSYVILYQ